MRGTEHLLLHSGAGACCLGRLLEASEDLEFGNQSVECRVHNQDGNSGWEFRMEIQDEG